MIIKKIRDLNIIELNNNRLVIACDSCGAIGMKEGDVLKVPPFYVGSFTTRVALLEVMCSGAEVITITNNVCNEMEPTGLEIIKGIKKELSEAGVDEIVLTGSTEENFNTTSTAVGITVIGMAHFNKLKLNSVEKPSVIVTIGYPKVGSEIDLEKDKEIVTYSHIKQLQAFEQVYEIVPVGSKGIQYECRQLAKGNNLYLKLEEQKSIDLLKSGGPATCVIAAISEDILKDLLAKIPNINVVGRLMDYDR